MTTGRYGTPQRHQIKHEQQLQQDHRRDSFSMPTQGIPSIGIRTRILPCCRTGEEKVRIYRLEYSIRFQRIRLCKFFDATVDISVKVDKEQRAHHTLGISKISHRRGEMSYIPWITVDIGMTGHVRWPSDRHV